MRLRVEGRERGEEGGATADDDGLLVSVLFNSTGEYPESSLALFDAADLSLVCQYPLGQVLPFHAHGIVWGDDADDELVRRIEAERSTAVTQSI